VLLPPVLKSRGASGPRGSSVGDFAQRIAAIGKTGGFHRRTRPGSFDVSVSGVPSVAAPRSIAPVAAPRVSPETRKRRRDVLTVLAAATSGSLLLAIVVQGALLWALFLVASALLVGYLVLLRHFVVHAAPAPGLFLGAVRTTPAVIANGPALTNVRFLPQSPPAPQFALRRTASS